MSKNITVGFHTTQPEPWIAAFDKAATAKGMTRSQWVGWCCRKQLSRETRNALIERPSQGRPKGSKNKVATR